MRYGLTEATHVLGKFDSGDTVTIALYDIATGTTVILIDDSCLEIGVTGVFNWNTSNLQTAPSVFTEYLWIMTNGTVSQYGKLALGGYPDNIDATVSSRLASADYSEVDNGAIADAVWDEEKTGHIGDLKSIADAADVSISSRLASADYVEPDNTNIGLIKTEVDSHPTLYEIEHSTILAKNIDVLNLNYNLDAFVSSIPTARMIRMEIDSNSVKLDQSLSVTEANIRGGAESLETIKTTINDIDIAAAVWDESKDGHIGDLKTMADTVELIKTDTGTLSTLSGIEESINTLSDEISFNTKFQMNAELVNNQLIIYDIDGVSEIAKFNLYDINGNPTMSNVYKRVRVL